VAAAMDMLLMLTPLRQSACHPNPDALQAELRASSEALFSDPSSYQEGLRPYHLEHFP
jgi:hypothetical protein